MNKKLLRTCPMVHLKTGLKNPAHVTRPVSVTRI